MASEPSSIEKEPAELILAAISQGIFINKSYLFYYCKIFKCTNVIFFKYLEKNIYIFIKI